MIFVATGKRFELEQVLRYRLDVERVRKQEFATAKQGFDHARDQLAQEEILTQNTSQEFLQRQREMDSIDEIRMYADFFARQREEIKKQKKRVDDLGHVLNERRSTLLDATKDKKALESLKEKKALEHKLEMDRKEQDFMDEIAIQNKQKVA